MYIEINVVGLQPLMARCEEVGANAQPLVGAAVTKAALFVQTDARLTAPHRTGNLQRSILMESDNIGTAKVSAEAAYAGFVELGTAAHVILPKNKKALMWPGAAHPVRSVNHPGTKANPFMERGVENATEEITTVFQGVADQIVMELAGA